MNSPKECLLAIDAGTGSCRSVIFDRDGNQISFSQREWRHTPIARYPGSQTFDTKSNWKLISLCIRESLQKARIDDQSKIKAVSTTSMREGMVLYNRWNEEIWACPNVDSRANKEAGYLVRSGKAKKIYFLSGDWVSITSPPRFLWIKKNDPEIFRETAHMGMLGDWILFKLCGQFVTEPSIGSSSGLFDLKKRTWSKEIIEICGLKEEVFPDLVQAGTPIGEVTREASSATGLKFGTPVVVGGADTQLGLAGLGITKPGQITIIGGSFWQHTILLDKPLVDPGIRLRTLCNAIPGQWMMEGIGFYCGLTMHWFRDAFCEDEKNEAVRLNLDPYLLMDRKAGTVPPGANGVLGIFSNLMNSARWVHASPAFIQFEITNPERSGKKECIRAIEEAAGFVSLGHLEIIELITKTKPKEITFTGGGSKSLLWPQILADMLEVQINVPVVKESTALGAAICAGVGAGYYKSLKTAGSDLIKFEMTFDPNSSVTKEYALLYQNWRKIYAEMQRISEEGLVAPLWKAAGT